MLRDAQLRNGLVYIFFLISFSIIFSRVSQYSLSHSTFLSKKWSGFFKCQSNIKYGTADDDAKMRTIDDFLKCSLATKNRLME